MNYINYVYVILYIISFSGILGPPNHNSNKRKKCRKSKKNQFFLIILICGLPLRGNFGNLSFLHLANI